MALVVLIVLALIVTFAILLSGCTAQDNSGQQGLAAQNGQPGSAQAPPAGQPYPPNTTYGMFNRSRFGMGNFSNLTDAQRQQLFASRMQQMQGACLGKSEGGACLVQGQNGGISGTCLSSNGTLSCSAGGMRNRAAYGN